MYYLRRDGIRIAGSVWIRGSGPETEIESLNGLVKVKLEKIIYALDEETYITRDGELHLGKASLPPPRGDRFKQLFTFGTKMALLTYNGKMYDFGGKELRIWNIGEITQIEDGFVLTRDGLVYPKGMLKSINLPERIIALFRNGIALSENGKSYRLMASGQEIHRPGIEWIYPYGVVWIGGILGGAEWIPETSLPILDNYGINEGVIDHHLKIVALTDHRFGGIHLKARTQSEKFSNVIQVIHPRPKRKIEMMIRTL